MTQHAQASVLVLICGILLLLGGLFGVYYQGPFWASGVVAAMNPEEDALALGLPVSVTLAGAFLPSYVLLASPLTAHWSLKKRGVAFAVFAVAVLAACAGASWLAGQVAGRELQKTKGTPNSMRELSELANRGVPGTEKIREWLRAALNECVLLPPFIERDQVLVRTEAPTRSPLGAIAYETGGVMVDGGWLCFLGSGHLPSRGPNHRASRPSTWALLRSISLEPPHGE